MVEFTLWQIIRNLLLATRWTLALSLVSFVGGGFLGIVVLLMKSSRWPWLRTMAGIFISIFQSTPLLMQIFLAFFGLALLGVDVTPWMAASTALILWTAAFLAEIWRGCVEAVPKGQWEASSSLGLRYLDQMRYVILPQAVRIAIPPTVGFLVQLVKSTALASIVGFMELSKVGVIIMNATLEPLKVFACTSTIYFVLCWSLSKASRALERRLNVVH
jgi:polar amino acid transport system permease protein